MLAKLEWLSASDFGAHMIEVQAEEELRDFLLMRATQNGTPGIFTFG
jgi:hypothetical protein